MQNLISNIPIQTMSSLEIAILTEKDHDKVIVDIRKMLDELKIGHADFRGSYKSRQNKMLPCFNLPRRECDILISGYSIKYRAAIVDRWQELESAQPKLPANYLEALTALVQCETEKQAALAENAKLTTIIDNEFGYSSILRAAKYLGVSEATFNWRLLKSSAIGLKLPPKRVPSPRYGYQNLYPIKAFELAYPQFDFDDLTPELVDDLSSLAIV